MANTVTDTPTTQTTEARKPPARVEHCRRCDLVAWVIPPEPYLDLELAWRNAEADAEHGDAQARQRADSARWGYRAAVESQPTHRGCGGAIERHRFTESQRARLARILAANGRIDAEVAWQLRSRLGDAVPYTGGGRDANRP